MHCFNPKQSIQSMAQAGKHLSWLGNGCSGHCMPLEHERYYGLALLRFWHGCFVQRCVSVPVKNRCRAAWVHGLCA